MAHYAPYRIPDETSIPDRLVILNQLIDAAWDDPDVVRMVATIRRSLPANASVRQRAQAALTAAQSRAYVPDPAGEEWFQSPGYTARFGGDCEDLASLFVLLARKLGLDARLVWITQPKQELNHVTAVVAYCGDWRWADASMRGARLGENPYDAVARLNAHHILGIKKAS